MGAAPLRPVSDNMGGCHWQLACQCLSQLPDSRRKSRLQAAPAGFRPDCHARAATRRPLWPV